MTKFAPSHFQGQDLICIRGERPVFSKLNFELKAGGCLTLIGHNGAGKSSLLRMMAGLLKPFSGQLLWDGTSISEDRETYSVNVHYVGHHDAVKPVLNVSENLRFWAALRLDDTKAIEAAIRESLEKFSISHLYDVPGRFLSAGQKRRVNLARILVSPAPLWLLDEPTTALDKQTIAALEQMISDHRSHGGMVVVSTHSDLKLADQDILDVGEFSLKNSIASQSLLSEGI